MSDKFPRVLQKSLDANGSSIDVLLVQLANGSFYFFSDNGFRFGTLAVGMPLAELARPTHGTVLLGAKHQVLAQSLAESLSHIVKNPVFVSLNFKTMEPPVDTLLSEAKRLYEEREGEEQTNE